MIPNVNVSTPSFNRILKKIKIKFLFYSLELTYFTSADSDVKENEFIENVGISFERLVNLLI